MLVKKLQSEIYFGTPYETISGVNVNAYFPASNHFQIVGSIGDFKYSTDLGGSWSNSTQAAVQLESDLDNIPLNSKRRNVPVVWNAAADINILYAFTNVKVKATFFDQASQAGSESEDSIITIDEIDMRPTEIIPLLRPYPGEDVFSIKFKTLVSLIQIKTHFQVQVAAEDDTSFSNPLVQKYSETDQTGWTLDGGAFPATGADTELAKADIKDVTFSHADLTALSSGTNYNVRVLRSLHDPAMILPKGTPDNW